jgi:hypothetical protein
MNAGKGGTLQTMAVQKRQEQLLMIGSKLG